MYSPQRLTVLYDVVGLVGPEADLGVPVALQGAGVDVGRASQHVVVVHDHQLQDNNQILAIQVYHLLLQKDHATILFNEHCNNVFKGFLDEWNRTRVILPLPSLFTFSFSPSTPPYPACSFP